MAKILAIDIETAPHTAHLWGLWNQNVGLSQLMETGRVLCFAAKWLGEKKVHYYSEDTHNANTMLQAAWDLIDEADMVLTYNGGRFDTPTLQKEFLCAGFNPPSPTRQVDLYKTVKKKFRFASNKMDHIAKELGIKGKVRHEGHELWVKCMAGDGKAWRKMRRYNIRDVLILEKLYKKLLPWIDNHPNLALYSESSDAKCCTNCGSTKLQRRGYAVSKVAKYVRYQCQKCGTWQKERFKEGGKMENILTQAPL